MVQLGHELHVHVVVVLLDILFRFVGLHAGVWYHTLHVAVAISILQLVSVFHIVHVPESLLSEATHAPFLNVHVIVLCVIA